MSGTTAGGSTYNRAGATTAGPQGYGHKGGGSVYNANTGKTTNWGSTNTANNHYADSSGNVYRGSRLAATFLERLVERRRRHLVGESGIAGAQRRR